MKIHVSSAVSLWTLAFILFTKRAAPEESCDSDDCNLNYRLPNDTYPEHYDITLTTNVNTGERAFAGEVVIDIAVEKDTNSIVLHASQLDISKVTLVNPSNGESEELSNSYELKREFLTLTREGDKAFPAESKWKVSIVYNGTLREDGRGLCISEYNDDAGNKHYFAFMEAQNRYAFPCYDEEGKIANFTITVIHSPTYNAISNTPVNGNLSSVGKTVFLTTPPTQISYISLFISDFGYSELTFNGITHRMYSRDNKTNEIFLVWDVQILEYFREYFGTGYVSPKFDLVELTNYRTIVDGSLGLSYFREEASRLNCADLKCRLHEQFKNIALIIGTYCFELTIFKSKSLDWFTGGIIFYIGDRAFQHVYPDFDTGSLFYEVSYLPSMTVSDLDIDEQIPDRRKRIVIVHMWINALTDRVFQKGLRNFFAKYLHTVVDDDQLFSIIQTAAEEENGKLPAALETMIDSWGHQMGYPILTVTRNYEDGTFTVKQQDQKRNQKRNDTKTWYVPFNFATASNPDFRDTKATHYLLNVSETSFDDVKIPQNDWLIFNKQSSGFYRVDYDADNWNLIAEGLIARPHNIHYLNRARLIYDVHFFAKRHQRDFTVALKLLSYLNQEDHPAPLYLGSLCLTLYYGNIRGSELHDDFNFFLLQLIRPMYEKQGFKKLQTIDYFEYTRDYITALACGYGLEECLEDVNNDLKDYLNQNLSDAFNLKYLKHALKQSSDEIFNIIYKKLMDTDDKDVRDALINSLASTENEAQIKKLIQSTVDNSTNLSSEERRTLISLLYTENVEGLLGYIEFLNENWTMIGKEMDENNSTILNKDILGMSKYVVNKKQEEKLLALVTKVKDSEYVTSSLEEDVKKNIADNMKWFSNIAPWLAQYRADNENGCSVKPTTSTGAVAA